LLLLFQPQQQQYTQQQQFQQTQLQFQQTQAQHRAQLQLFWQQQMTEIEQVTGEATRFVVVWLLCSVAFTLQQLEALAS
jgi:hypothetical protein